METKETKKTGTTHWKVIVVVLAVLLVFTALIAATSTIAITKHKSKEEATNAAALTSAQTVSAKSKEKRKVIIDTDTAGDDAVALIIAAKTENVDILGVTVSEGNVTLAQALKNALMTLELTKCNAPVYPGASSTYTGKVREAFSVYGKDGMGDNGLINPKRTAESKNAVDFILETVKANPGEVEIIALGPVTNLSLAFDKDPETMKLVKKYWSMGTSGLGPGNATPVAEFNVYHDAEAYKVFAESGVPITAIGLDMLYDDTLFTKQDLDELEKKGGLPAFVAKAFAGLVKFNTEARGKPIADIPDGVAMACALWDGYMLETSPCHACVMTDDDESYGQVILYQEGYGYDSEVKFEDYNFNVVTKTASDTFKSTLYSLLEK